MFLREAKAERASGTRDLRPSERTIFDKLDVAPPPQFLSLSPRPNPSTDPPEEPPPMANPA
jgi:hypothetical protein